MRNISIDKIKELLEAYGINDVENYSYDYISEEDIIQQYSLSESIKNSLDFIIGAECHEEEQAQINRPKYMIDLIKLSNFLGKCSGEVSISGIVKSPTNIKYSHSFQVDAHNIKFLKKEIDKILEEDESYLMNYIDGEGSTPKDTDWKMLKMFYSQQLPKKANKGSLGGWANYLKEKFDLQNWGFKTKQRLQAFIYDMLMIAGLVWHDDLAQIGDKSAERHKSQYVDGWRRAYK